MEAKDTNISTSGKSAEKFLAPVLGNMKTSENIPKEVNLQIIEIIPPSSEKNSTTAHFSDGQF